MSNDEPSADERWQAHVAWMNDTYEFYFAGQQALGATREQAVERLKQVWAREDAARLRALGR